MCTVLNQATFTLFFAFASTRLCKIHTPFLASLCLFFVFFFLVSFGFFWFLLVSFGFFWFLFFCHVCTRRYPCRRTRGTTRPIPPGFPGCKGKGRGGTPQHVVDCQRIGHVWQHTPCSVLPTFHHGAIIVQIQCTYCSCSTNHCGTHAKSVGHVFAVYPSQLVGVLWVRCSVVHPSSPHRTHVDPPVSTIGVTRVCPPSFTLVPTRRSVLVCSSNQRFYSKDRD